MSSTLDLNAPVVLTTVCGMSSRFVHVTVAPTGTEISVFIWPTVETDAAPRSGSHQGYQWISWRKSGMEFYAVSNAAESELEQLQQLFSKS